MPPKPKDPTRIEKRRATVANMCLAGASSRDIAKQLGVSDATVSNDLKAMREYWKKEQVTATQEAIAQQLAELDWMRTQVRGNSDVKLTLKIRALLDIQQQEAKLLGLYAPARTEVTNTEPIEVIWRMVDEADNSDT